VEVSYIGGGNIYRVLGENHRPATSHKMNNQLSTLNIKKKRPQHKTLKMQVWDRHKNVMELLYGMENKSFF
jgi:hypothetical protein